MVKRIIPGNMSPWECEINDVKYVYPPGTEQMVPDEVAHVIDAWYASQEPKYPEPVQPEGGGGSVTPEQVEDAVEATMLENGIIKRELLPDGYPYSGMTEILSVTDGAVTDDGYPVTQPLGLVIGNTYEVNWNSTLYSCVAEGYEMDGIVFAALGDAGILGGVEPTGKYPFVMIEMPEGMAEGGIYAAVMPLDGSETVTFSVFGGGNIPIDKKWLPEGYPYIVEAGVTVVQEKQYIPEGGAILLPSFNKSITYKVTWNGTEYTVAPIVLPNNGFGVDVCWGNPEIFGLEGTEEPFVIMIREGSTVAMVLDESTAVTLKVVTERSYVAMDSRYMPGGGGMNLMNGSASGSLIGTRAASESDSYSIGSSSMAIGYQSKAPGDNALAFGSQAVAEGDYSFAFGDGAKTTNVGAFALGVGTEASGVYAFAEGWLSKAVEWASHAEGSSIASGRLSHAEGSGTKASGKHSHAEGFKTIAASEGQHVQGECNIEDADRKYAHIVGNGYITAGNDVVRSNAHTLDWAGNAWFAGSVEGTVLILKSHGGKRFKVTVSDSGGLTATEITA